MASGPWAGWPTSNFLLFVGFFPWSFRFFKYRISVLGLDSSSNIAQEICLWRCLSRNFQKVELNSPGRLLYSYANPKDATYDMFCCGQRSSCRDFPAHRVVIDVVSNLSFPDFAVTCSRHKLKNLLIKCSRTLPGAGTSRRRGLGTHLEKFPTYPSPSDLLGWVQVPSPKCTGRYPRTIWLLIIDFLDAKIKILMTNPSEEPSSKGLTRSEGTAQSFPWALLPHPHGIGSFFRWQNMNWHL